MENTKKQMMKMLKGYGEGLVRSVCEAYGLNYEEVLKKVMGEEEEVKRGRPEKKAKRVVNKELVVEDVIMKGLMAEVEGEAKVAEEEKVAEVEEAKPVKEKKKGAPKKKEAEAEGGGSGEEVKEKKKRAPKKKQAEAEGGSSEEAKPVEAKPAVEEPKTIGGFAVKSAEEMKPKVKDIAVKAASPAKEEVEEELEEELEEEETETEEIEYNGIAYLVTDDSVVFDSETREAVGTWDGTAVKFYTGDEE